MPSVFGKSKRVLNMRQDSEDEFVGLLDLVPGAYNLAAWDCSRRLGGLFDVPPVRLRRDSDNAERDFYATTGFIDESEVTTWAGGSFHIGRQYDQTGNNRDAVQATAGSQPVGTFVGGRLEAVYAAAYLDFYSASLAAAYSFNEGSYYSRIKVSASGVWTDGAQRNFISTRADASNRIFSIKSTTNNRIVYSRFGGGTSKNVNLNSMTTTAFFQPASTWSITVDQFIAYVDGAQTGATQTAIGTAVGTLDTANAVLGAQNTSLGMPWSGSITASLLFNFPLTSVQVSTINTFLNT